MTGRIVDGIASERMGLVTMAVPPAQLDEVVESIAADVDAIPPDGQLHHKESLNTALEIQSVGALFRYHGQMNALCRIGAGLCIRVQRGSSERQSRAPANG